MARYVRGNDYSRQTYNFSNNAYAYDVYTEEVEIDVRKQREAKKRLLLEKKARKIHRLKLLVAMAIVFVGCVLTMVANASVVEQRFANKKLNEKLIQLQMENSALSAEISNKVDLAYVEQEAVSRLGMTAPQEYQMVYVSVPKESYTVQYDVTEEEEQGFSLSSIVGLFRK